jgi:hypothetical protein
VDPLYPRAKWFHKEVLRPPSQPSTMADARPQRATAAKASAAWAKHVPIPRVPTRAEDPRVDDDVDEVLVRDEEEIVVEDEDDGDDDDERQQCGDNGEEDVLVRAELDEEPDTEEKEELPSVSVGASWALLAVEWVLFTRERCRAQPCAGWWLWR